MIRDSIAAALGALRQWIPSSAGDASPVAGSSREDSLYSSALGLGDWRDKRTSLRPAAPPRLSDDELDMLSVDEMARLVDQPAQECMARGYRVDMDSARDVTHDMDQRLGVHAALVGWLCTSRRGRGSHIWMVDGDADWSQPRTEATRTERLQVLSHRDATPVAWDTDPLSPTWLRPTMWRVQPLRPGAGVASPTRLIHASRLITHYGAPMPPHMSREVLGYDGAMWERYWPSLRALGSVLLTAETAGLELITPWIRLGSIDGITGDARAQVLAALSALQRSRSSYGLTVMSPGDEMGREALQLTGMSDIVATAWQRVAAVRGHPLTVLLGSPPAGLTSDDESGRQSWARLLDVEAAEYERAIHRLCDAEGIVGERTIEWGPIWVPSADELADTDLKLVQRDEILQTMGVASTASIAARYSGPTVLPYPVIEAPDANAARSSLPDMVAAVVAARDAGLMTSEDAVAAIRAAGLPIGSADGYATIAETERATRAGQTIDETERLTASLERLRTATSAASIPSAPEESADPSVAPMAPTV